MENLEGILKLTDNELEAIVKNGKYRSREEVDSVYKLIDIAKDIYCIWEYEGDEMSEDYSRGYPVRQYDGGHSYARGRKRDSMGRFSRDGYYREDRYRGYARDGHDEYREHLMQLMDEAPDENARQSIKRMIDNMA